MFKILRLTFIVLAFCIFSFASSPTNFSQKVIPVSLSQAQSVLDQGVYFFDVNTPQVRQEYGYIPGARFVDTEKVMVKEDWDKILPKDKNAELVFYCLNRLCFASTDAALVVKQLGYKNVYVMLEGIQAWIISGREVVKFSKTKSSKKPLVKEIGSEQWVKSKEIKDFHDGIHSKLFFGQIPSCRDCHGSNGIKINLANDKDNVNNNCASCHKETKMKFANSVHDKSINKKENSPLCSDCHSIHTKNAATEIDFKQLNDQKCGTCHEKEQKHYHDTFHGKAMVLNLPGEAPSVAACYDCHGSHAIFKPTDAKSTLFGENKIKTCAKCHEGSNENFAGFIAHADHTDKANYPVLFYAFIFMTSLVIAVFSFFGLHTFLWSIRLIMLRIKHPKEWKKARLAAHNDKIEIKRFTTFHRIQHFFMASSFLGLSFSGLPQKFYTAPWAESMIDFMGGPIQATKIHHFCAFIMFLVFFSHIGEVWYKALKYKESIRDEKTKKLSFKKALKALFGPDSLMPNLQDIAQMKEHIKWFFNKGARPQFDRWTYWEKFDYLAVFWGMFIIGFSGLMLWFPTFFTNFMPGWMLNLATIVHSDEALLATGFIFAIHFFNTHFRADRFPMDMVIFSGNITKEEMMQERSKWYERLMKNGNFDKLIVKKSNFSSYKYLAKLVGFAMLITGLIFLFLIIYAYYNVIFS